MGKILVTGASGQVGRRVVEQLGAVHADLRVSGRDPAALGGDAVYADLTRPETLPAALAGVSKVFLYTMPTGIDGFLGAAAEAGIEQIVLLSSQTVVDAIPQRRPIAEMHRVVEEAIAASGIPYTFLRPENFATNILMWGWPEMIRADGVLRFPYPESHSDAIHEADIAAVAVAALTEPGHEGRSYFLTGPESITQREQLEIIGEAVGKPVRYEELTDAEAREALRPIVPEWVMDAVVGYWAHTDGVPAPITDEVLRITGVPPRSFKQWAVDHVADFS
ncbi:NAD(P)H-binding protein [Actinophytocola sp.]|uniref:NAD(P)H-binding protein n=1 Tax=Actinophytocola sp. TaxID=1872138 RepID=UPI00389B2187